MVAPRSRVCVMRSFWRQSLDGFEVDFARRAAGVKFLGIHRTMHEETSDDFLIGCVDYFRHNRRTRPAFTDSVFESARNAAIANIGYFSGLQKTVWTQCASNFLQTDQEKKG